MMNNCPKIEEVVKKFPSFMQGMKNVCHMPYSGIFLLVQNFADLPTSPPEEIFVVFIFMLPG